MKSIITKFMLAASVVAGISLSSCKQDKCMSVICANGGECNNDGSCTCAPGYEGERCETATRDKFKGVWDVIEDGTITNPQNYTVSVSNAPEIDQVFINNFNNFANSEIKAKVIGDTLYIPNQIIEQDGAVKTVEGKGYFVTEPYYDLHGVLMVKYRVTDDEGIVNDYGYRGAGDASRWTK